jgi:hypothetical protein
MDALKFVRSEPAEQRGEVRDAPLAPSLHHALPLGGCVHPHDAPVVRIGSPSDETVFLQCLDDARHRRRSHLLGGGQLAERARAAEDEHRQRRELGGRDARCRVFPPNVPERMDRGRVEAIGRLG